MHLRGLTKNTYILLIFIAIKFLLQYSLITSDYDLHRDEYLHLDQGNHLAWGYVSVPPVNSWLAFVIKLLGNGEFWVKFFPAAFGALTVLVVWKTIEKLNGNLFALILGASGVLFSVLLRLNTLFQPNSLDVLCWTLLYYIVIRYIQSEKVKWLYAAAIVLAFGFLNKYNIIFLLLGFLPALLLTRERKLLFDKRLLHPLVLCFLLVSPNLIWQYHNGFPVVHHMKLLAETQLVNVSRIDFLKSQLLFFLGALPVIIAALYALLLYSPFKPYRVFFWSLFFTLGIFMIFKAKDYYAIGIYPIYIAFGAVYLSTILQTGWTRYLRPIAVVIPVLIFIPMYNVVFPNKTPGYIRTHAAKYESLGMLRWEDGKNHALPQDFADMLGWKELASKVDDVYAHMPHPEATLVLCDNYGQAGAINYYSAQGIRAVSFNADYVDWFDLTIEYKNLIRVKEHPDSNEELAETAPYFRTSFVADSITNVNAREYGTTIFAFVDARVNINERLRKEIEEAKAY